MTMDMQTGIFCGVFSILASLIVYGVLSFYSIKEDSFDEARANRRKLIKEYVDRSRSNSEKTKQKKTKKNIKKAKEKKSDTADEYSEDPQEHDNQEIPNEQPISENSLKNIEPLDAVKNTLKPKIQASSPVENEIDINSTSDLINEPNFKKINDKKSKVKCSEKSPESENPIEAPVKESDKKIRIETKCEKKKQTDMSYFRKSTSTDKQDINVNSVLTVIDKAVLSRTEIQVVIDVLLNSCEDETSDWLKVKKLDSGRQDSTTKLKKQLLESDISLKNEKQVTSSLQGKLKDLRTENASDKSTIASLKDAINKLQKEKDDLIYENSDLSSKFKSVSRDKEELQEQLSQELTKVKNLNKQDNDQHHEAVAGLNKQLSSLNAQLNAVENDNTTLKSAVENLEEELKSHKDCQDRIRDSEKSVNLMKDQVKQNEILLNETKQKVVSLNSVLETVKLENEDLRKDREQLINEISLSRCEIQSLKGEVESKAMELVELQTVQNNGNVYDDKHDSLKCEYLLVEKENLIKHLNSELDKNNASLNELNQELGRINIENKKLANYAEESAKENVALKEKMDNTVDELQGNINKLRNDINEKNGELSSLSTEVENYKQRNNELRNKNWKLAETLSDREKTLLTKLKAEESLQDKLKMDKVENVENINKAINELKNNVNDFIDRIFPNIVIQKHEGQFNDWLRSVEEAVNTSNMNNSSKDFKQQYTQLQLHVMLYKNIISDTEDTLDRLQNLIELEEAKQKQDILNLKEELESLRNMQGSTSAVI